MSNVAFLDTKSTFVTFDVEITIESKSASSKLDIVEGELVNFFPPLFPSLPLHSY